MKNYLLALIALLLSQTALAQDCTKHLQAFTLWEDEINGQIVLKHSAFDIPDWDPNSQYESLALTADAIKNVKKPILEVEFKGGKTGKKKLETFRRLKPLAQDPNLSAFDDFQAEEFFDFKEAGQYTVRLKDENTLICSQTFKLSLGH